MNLPLSFYIDDAKHEVLVSLDNPQLQSGVGQHGLRLTATVHHHDFLGGMILLQGDSEVVASGGHPREWLANFAYDSPLYLRELNIGSDCKLVAPVSDEQLWRIEDMRRGNDFQIGLRLNAVLMHQGHAYPMISPMQYQLRVDRDMWLRQLANVQRAAHFMVAVPAGGDGADGMASVVRFLREAEAAYRDNRDRDAATAVRKALERFKPLITLPTAKSITNLNPDQRDEHQRWALMYHALTGVLNAAPHGDEVTEKIEFNRRDGQAVIAIALALIGRRWN
ncbi:hypothetical protein [Micromonospora echinospora]